MLWEKNKCIIFCKIAILPSWGQRNWENTLGFAKFHYFLVKISLHLSESRCTLVKISLHPSQKYHASWTKSHCILTKILLHVHQNLVAPCPNFVTAIALTPVLVRTFTFWGCDFLPKDLLSIDLVLAFALSTLKWMRVAHRQRGRFHFPFLRISSAL